MDKETVRIFAQLEEALEKVVRASALSAASLGMNRKAFREMADALYKEEIGNKLHIVSVRRSALRSA